MVKNATRNSGDPISLHHISYGWVNRKLHTEILLTMLFGSALTFFAVGSHQIGDKATKISLVISQTYCTFNYRQKAVIISSTNRSTFRQKCTNFQYMPLVLEICSWLILDTFSFFAKRDKLCVIVIMKSSLIWRIPSGIKD